MNVAVEVLLSPAEYLAREGAGFSGKVCVVFDVLRATSVMVTGLARGAAGFLPVTEIAVAVARHKKFPAALLAGEREGWRITAAQSGGVEFELGNSPREYTAARVAGKLIITTTTNGTRAMQVCHGATAVLAGAFLNLRATSEWLVQNEAQQLVLVCAGTGAECAFEDVLGAGALVARLRAAGAKLALDDAAVLAWRAFAGVENDLAGAVQSSRNAQRLRAQPELAADVDFCLQVDAFDVVARQGADGVVRRALATQ